MIILLAIKLLKCRDSLLAVVNDLSLELLYPINKCSHMQEFQLPACRNEHACTSIYLCTQAKPNSKYLLTNQVSIAFLTSKSHTMQNQFTHSLSCLQIINTQTKMNAHTTTTYVCTQLVTVAKQVGVYLDEFHQTVPIYSTRIYNTLLLKYTHVLSTHPN